MENKVVEKQKQVLINKLSPIQQEHLESLDWFYNGGRGSGRTFLSCTIALIGLLNGNHESYIIDHHPFFHEGIISYTKNMIHSLADEIGLAIEIKNVKNGFVIRKAPEYIQYEYDLRKKDK